MTVLPYTWHPTWAEYMSVRHDNEFADTKVNYNTKMNASIQRTYDGLFHQMFRSHHLARQQRDQALPTLAADIPCSCCPRDAHIC